MRDPIVWFASTYFKFIYLSILLYVSLPNAFYSRRASSALNQISAFLFINSKLSRGGVFDTRTFDTISDTFAHRVVLFFLYTNQGLICLAHSRDYVFFNVVAAGHLITTWVV